MNIIFAHITIIILLIIMTNTQYNEDSAIKPKFKVNDCFTLKSNIDNYCESWEKDCSYTIEKVLLVGKFKYRTEVYSTQLGRIILSESPFYNDDIMVKVNCPK